MSGILGLDLSLTSSGLCYIPDEWVPGDWDSLVTASVGLAKKQADTIDRLIYIRDSILYFADSFHVSHVFIENYAFGKRFQAHQLGELGGVVRVGFVEKWGMYPVALSCLHARGWLFGKIARKDMKKIVVAGMKSAGFIRKTTDEVDAWVVANFGLSTLGKASVTFQKE